MLPVEFVVTGVETSCTAAAVAGGMVRGGGEEKEGVGGVCDVGVRGSEL